jgi:hypothetical protein
MNINSLPESIIKLIGSYLYEVHCEKILVRCEYFIKRKIEIYHEVIKILQKNYFKKKDIAKVAEVFFNNSYIYPKNTVETQRDIDYQPKGCEYIKYTHNEFNKVILGNLYSHCSMLKDTLKYNLLRYPQNILYKNTENNQNTKKFEIKDYQRSEEYRIYSLHNAYLLLSVCKYISKPI